MAGGGARLPKVAAQSANWGLAGIEFGVNIPGTVGGAVRMNANAYGGALGEVLDWVDVCTPAGVDRRAPGDLALRVPQLQHRRARGRLAGLLRPCARRRATTSRRRWPTCAGAATRRSPRASRPSGPPSSTPTDPRAEGRSAGQLLDAAGARGPRARRRPPLPEARELRRELRGRGHDRRRARGDGGGPAGRPRAVRSGARARGAGPRRCRVARRLEPRECRAAAAPCSSGAAGCSPASSWRSPWSRATSSGSGIPRSSRWTRSRCRARRPTRTSSTTR